MKANLLQNFISTGNQFRILRKLLKNIEIQRKWSFIFSSMCPLLFSLSPSILDWIFSIRFMGVHFF